MARLARVVLVFVTLLSLGFEWEGRLARLRRELETGDAERRREVVRMLATYPGHEVRDALLTALGDEDASVRIEAAQATGRVRLREAVPRLLDWLDDEDAEVRTSAASALGRIGDPRTVQPIVRALGDSSGDVRRAAVRALRAVGTPEVVVPLLGRLDDPDGSVQVEAAEALGELRDARAVVPLIGRARDQAPEVRGAVYDALGSIGDPRATPALLQGVRDDVDTVRLAAVASLGRLGDPSAVETLATAASRSDSRMARACVAALGAIGGADALTAVVAALSSREAKTLAGDLLVAAARRGAVSQEEHPVDIVGMLIDSLDRASSFDAAALAGILARISLLVDDPRIGDALLRALEGGRAPSAALLAALAATGSEAALVPILEALRSPDASQQGVALDALAAYFDRRPADGRAADPLLNALGRVDPPKRVAVVRLLGRVRATRALPALRPLLGHAEVELRLAAVEAIGAIGDPEGGTALIELLDDRDSRTRFEAARALRNAASPALVHTLVQKLLGRDPTDRHAVVLALGGVLERARTERTALGGEAHAAREALVAVAAGPDLPLAARAVDALARAGTDEAVAALAALVEEGSPAITRYVAMGLALVDGGPARELARRLLAHRSADVRAAAAFAIGEHGEASDLAALATLVREGGFPAKATAAFAIARLARRGALDASHGPAICALTTTRDPWTAANLGIALAAAAAPACENGASPERWMDPRFAAVQRAAAVRWLERAPGIAESARHALFDRCVARELSADVAEACRSPGLPALGDAVDVYAYAVDGRRLLVDSLVALRLSDGSVLVLRTDANGHLSMTNGPRGRLLLEDPTNVPLSPGS